MRITAISFRTYLAIFVLIIGFSGCNKDTSSPVDDSLTLNGKSYKPTEFSATQSLNQLVIVCKNTQITSRLVFYNCDSGTFIIKPNSAAMKKNDAAAQLSINGKVYFGQVGKVKLRKSGANTYSGEYEFDSVLDDSWIELRNGSFKDVTATVINYGTVEDREGNSYKTIKIGDQTWMAENLRSKKFHNGSSIPHVKMYNNDDSLVQLYGRLYTWAAAMNGKSVEMTQGVCPEGWHIPSEAEVTELVNNLGGGKTAGNNLKASVSWLDDIRSPSDNNKDLILNNNSSGFTLLAAGSYNGDSYSHRGYYGSFWNSTSPSKGFAGYVSFGYSSGDVLVHNFKAENRAFPVRCIKNN